ncbi:hypothetical protein Athe_2721 [Caldicellulosiruptor bescii DSM 6725]|uniref:Uncharacterized protein n=1 Tax=Caldicellulosiruptor bescii (strain ATCC BAA-1888 / DSM 6725 / KCTC 15123 / Z-1320) TaxID=521460 RepID=B9MPZ1_CALBD|nr:hypothetical protein Athe_2721 [Caldicellulosiruptor bescii DSM 6725]
MVFILMFLFRGSFNPQRGGYKSRSGIFDKRGCKVSIPKGEATN